MLILFLLTNKVAVVARDHLIKLFAARGQIGLVIAYGISRMSDTMDTIKK